MSTYQPHSLLSIATLIAEFTLTKTLGPFILECLGWQQGFVYVLQLEQENYYIGQSLDLSRRIGEHFLGTFLDEGARWTKAHNPIKVLQLFPITDVHKINDYERMVTIAYMSKFGTDKVRGAGWCTVNYNYSNTLVEYPDINFDSLKNVQPVESRTRKRKTRPSRAKKPQPTKKNRPDPDLNTITLELTETPKPVYDVSCTFQQTAEPSFVDEIIAV